MPPFASATRVGLTQVLDAMRKVIAAVLATVVVGGCTIAPPKTIPCNAFTIGRGYSCFADEFSPVANPKKFLCIFPLEQASPYYHEETRTKSIEEFIARMRRTCRIGSTYEMQDPRYTLEHSFGVVVTAVTCD